MSRLMRHKTAEDETGVDLTPMLDVVFIMLIFFIVTASFVREAGLEMTRPDPSEEQQQSEARNIVFQVMASNEVWLEGRRIDIRSVRANVERMHAENPDAAVIIQSHPQARNHTLTEIADQSREAKVYDISLVISED